MHASCLLNGGAERPIGISAAFIEQRPACQVVAGTSALSADTDGDGLVDGEDGAPLQALGTETLWAHVDHLGGVSALTDATGQVVWRMRYGVHGEIRSNVRAGPPSMATRGRASVAWPHHGR